MQRLKQNSLAVEQSQRFCYKCFWQYALEGVINNLKKYEPPLFFGSQIDA